MLWPMSARRMRTWLCLLNSPLRWWGFGGNFAQRRRLLMPCSRSLRRGWSLTRLHGPGGVPPPGPSGCLPACLPAAYWSLACVAPRARIAAEERTVHSEHASQGNATWNAYIHTVIIVVADGKALTSAMPSATTIMTQIVPTAEDRLAALKNNHETVQCVALPSSTLRMANAAHTHGIAPTAQDRLLLCTNT